MWPKIISYAGLSTKSLSMVCVHWNFVDRILKTHGGLMEKFDSQPIKSNHEYQIMKYFSATLCHNVPQNKMEQ